MADEPDAPTTGASAFAPLSTYQDFDHYWDRLTSNQSTKSPSLLALQALTHSKPDLARSIFDRTVMEPFYRLLANTFPAVPQVSDEAAKRIEDLRARFLQEPTRVLRMLEAIFVIERVEPWARDTVKLMSKGRTTLEKIRERNDHYTNKVEGNAAALGIMDLGMYVRERNYRIMLELVHAIDGRPVEEQAARILNDLPTLKKHWDAYGDGTADSLIGPEGAKRIASWIFGYVEF